MQGAPQDKRWGNMTNMKARNMQPGQCSPVQEAAAHEFCSRLGAISSVSEAAPAVQALGEPQVVHMLPYSSSVLALPGGQHWGTAEQTAAAHQRGLQCMSDWSRSVKAMTAASHQLQPQHLRQPFLPSCASLPGSVWPVGPAAQFQSHQQACMDGFQRFLGQDAPRTDTAAAMLAPALQGVPAEQHPRIALPVALMEPGQEPNQLLASSAGHHRTAGLPSLPRPSARTAPVPLTGLYAQDSSTAARKSWRLPNIHDQSNPPVACRSIPEDQQMTQGPLQACSRVRKKVGAAEANRVAAVPAVTVSAAAHGDITLNAPDLVSEHLLSTSEQATHAACSRVLESSAQPSEPSAAGQAACKPGAGLPGVHEGAQESAAAYEAEASMPCSSPSKGRHMPQLKNSLVMRCQSPEWLDCSEASAGVSRDLDDSAHEATAAQQSLRSKACTASAEHESSAQEHRDQAVLDICESPQQSPQVGSKPHGAAQDGVLLNGGDDAAAMVRKDAEQPVGSLEAGITAEDAKQIQAPSSAAQAVAEDVMAACAPAAPALATGLPPSPTARKAQAAEELQPVLVTSYMTNPEVPDPTDALDTTGNAAIAVEALLGLAKWEGVPAHEAQAGAHLKPADARAALYTGDTAAQEAAAAEQAADMQPAAAEQPAAMPARYALSEGNGRCLDLVQACQSPQHSGRVSQSASRSSAIVSGESESEGGATIPVRVCDMALVSRECLSDLATLAPSAWQRAHSLRLDVPPCSATPQPPANEASAEGHSQTSQAVPEMPGTGLESSTPEQGLTLRAQATRGNVSVQGTGGRPQRAAVREPPAAGASKAAGLAEPPQSRTSKELAMLQAEGVPEVDRLAKLAAAGHVTRRQASALSDRQRRALLRQRDSAPGRLLAPPACPRRPPAAPEQGPPAKATRPSRVRPAARSHRKAADRSAARTQTPTEQMPELQPCAADGRTLSAKAPTANTSGPARRSADGRQAPERKRSRLGQPLGAGVSVPTRRVSTRPHPLGEQKLKLRQRSSRGELANLQSMPVRATRHAAGASSAEPGTGRPARQDCMALPETREEAIRMRMDQCAAVTNARKDIGIMRVPLETSLGVRRSRALSARAALAQQQVAAGEAQVTPSMATPVRRSSDSELVVQHVSDAQQQAQNQDATALEPAPAKDVSPTREVPDIVVPPPVNELAWESEAAPPQRQRAAVMEPCSEAAAVPPEAAAAPLPDLALPEAPPAEHASSAPCSVDHRALHRRSGCRRVARRTEPCTEEGALLKAPLPVLPGSAAPCDEAVTCAPGRLKRVPGGDPLQNKQIARLCGMIRANSREFQADGRVLRLKQYVSSDVRPSQIDAILDALAANTRVEVLYIQNFEWGMLDAQLEHLSQVLTSKHIWALNVGENFQISITAWERFSKALEATAVGYMYVSEHHLKHTDLKIRMRDVIRVNRKAGPRRDPEVICKVGNMWFNPKMPDAAPRRPKGVNPRAAPAQPLARQLAVARSAATFGANRSTAIEHKAAAARPAAQQLDRRRALEYHPQVTPPKAYGPKRVAPAPFVHLEGTGSGQVLKSLVRGRLGSRAGRLAPRPKDYNGPMLCTVCGVTQTPCWRRHHRTRALLCNRCGVKVNALGAYSRTNHVSTRRRASQESILGRKTPPEAKHFQQAKSWDEVPSAQRAPLADCMQSSSPNLQAPARKGPAEFTPVRRPPSKARYACEDCGAPVEQDVDSSPDTILCSTCCGSSPRTRAGRLQGEAILSPKQVESMRAQVAYAVRAMQDSMQLNGSHRQGFMPGQHAALGKEPGEACAAPQAAAQPGTEHRTVIEQIGLLSGTLRTCAAVRCSEQPGAAAATLAPDGTRAPSCAGPVLCGAPLSVSAAVDGARQHSILLQLCPAYGEKLPTGGSSIEPGDKERGRDMQQGAAASQDKRKLDCCAPEAERSAKRACEGASMPEAQPHRAPMPCPGDKPLAHGCSPDAGCAAAAEQGGTMQRRGSAQAGSRVRMKQRELVPVRDLLASKYRLPGRSPPKNLLSEDEELLTLWLWTHKPRSKAGETWAPSIRSRAC